MRMMNLWPAWASCAASSDWVSGWRGQTNTGDVDTFGAATRLIIVLNVAYQTNVRAQR